MSHFVSYDDNRFKHSLTYTMAISNTVCEWPQVSQHQLQVHAQAKFIVIVGIALVGKCPSFIFQWEKYKQWVFSCFSEQILAKFVICVILMKVMPICTLIPTYVHSLVTKMWKTLILTSFYNLRYFRHRAIFDIGYDATVTSYMGCWYLFWYEWLEKIHS